MIGKERLANPWWIVAGSTVALTVSLGTVNAALGLFVRPLQAEFGWDRATISGAKGISSVLAAFALVAVGGMVDRWGVRRVAIPAIMAFGLTVVLMSMTQSLAYFVGLLLLLGVTGAGHSPLGYVKSVSAFFDDRRGLAIGVALAGTGIGNTIVSQYASWTIAQFGWRGGFVGLGGLIWLVAAPAVFFFVRDPSAALAGRAQTTGDTRADGELPGHSLGEAMRSRPFWTITVLIVVMAASVNGILFHLVPMLVDRGVAPAAAARIFIAFGLATICGRFVIGWSFDKWFAPHVIAPALLLAATGLMMMRADGLVLLGAACLGITVGAELDMIGYLSSRYFGLRRQGQISGIFYALVALGLATGEYGYGLIQSRSGSYDAAILSAIVLLVSGAALVLTLGRYNYAPAYHPNPSGRTPSPA